MAKRIIEELIDDLDGSKAQETTTFSVDGKSYEIDLSKSNKVVFLKELKLYIDHARTLKGRAAVKMVRRPDLPEIRAWAAANKYPSSARGRIPQATMDAYDAEH